MKTYVLCISNDIGEDFDEGDIVVGRAYEMLGHEGGLWRIVDESGEDYLYPASLFEELSLSASARLADSFSRLAA